MTLYDILRATRYWQKFCCYVTNSYDQNVPIGFGTRRELLDEEQNDFTKAETALKGGRHERN